MLQDISFSQIIKEKMTPNRTILTIATGKKYYIDLAVNLARSFLWWHKDSGIKFKLVTDHPEYLPADLQGKIVLHNIQPGELGTGFSSKLFLDQLADEGQTLFIDSDCLIFDNLEPVFDRFKGHKVSVVGGYISDGEWFGDIKAVCSKFNLPHLPKFNGGIYYIEKGPEAAAVYNTARSLETQYDEIGFVRLRNQPNDELVMALAMQLHGQQPVPDDGTIMSDPQACPGGYKIDVINGGRWLINPPLPDERHQSWYPFEKVSPVVFHFLGYYTADHQYIRESYRLEKALSGRLNWLSEFAAKLRIELPMKITRLLKDTFRPVYHKLFGYRKVKSSQRL